MLLKNTNNISEIVRQLNNNGFVTSQGCKFTNVQVNRLIKMYDLKQKAD